MKKLFILFTLCLGISASIFAQASAMSNCNGPTNTITPHPAGTAGLSPSDSVLPCATRGVAVSDTIYFTNYTTLMYHGVPITMTSLTIDSLFLPNGLCWSTNSATNTFTTGQAGIIYVSGTTNDSAGQYKLRIIVTAVTSFATLSEIDAEQYAGLAYRVRVREAGCGCPEIDASHADSALRYVPYTAASCSQNSVGIKDISSDVSNVSVVPNPFSSTAKVTFNSDVEGIYTVKMVNLLGSVVSSKEVSVSTGTNEFAIERNGLSSGIYILSMSNGSSSISRKVIIE